MTRQSRRIGRSLLYVLENASTQHLRLYLEQPDENFAVVSAASDDLKDNDETSPRDTLTKALTKLSFEALQPVETESQRFFLLAEGKGPDSCPPVLNRHLCNEDFEAWESQPDDCLTSAPMGPNRAI